MRDSLTGMLDRQDEKVLFFNESFNFTFFTDSVAPEKHLPALKADDGFLRATTHYKKKIAIYTGASIEPALTNKISLPTPIYIESEYGSISNHDIDYFNEISFSGGIIDTLNFDIVTVLQKSEVKRGYAFSINGSNCTVSTGFYTENTFGLANSTQKKVFYFRVYFEKAQPLNMLLWHYDMLRKVFSFLTHQVETRIEKIEIKLTTEQNELTNEYALVHIKSNDECNERYCYKAILFSDLGEALPKLLELVYNAKYDKKRRVPIYSLDFIPLNEKDQQNITNETVRAVVSSLECECDSNISISNEQEAVLSPLVNKVIEAINQYKEDNPKAVGDETYNLINNNIETWSFTAAEQVWMLVCEFKEEMDAYCEGKEPLQKEKIKKLIQYRNIVSHGNYGVMDSEIRKTAIDMKVLVYCSLLHRLGVSKDIILRLCREQFQLFGR